MLTNKVVNNNNKVYKLNADGVLIQSNRVLGSTTDIYNIFFNNFDLMSACPGGKTGIGVNEADFFDAVVENTIEQYTNSDGGVVLGKRLPTRQLNLTLFIEAKTNAILETILDELKVKLNVDEAFLGYTIKQGNTRKQRIARATFNSINVPNFSRLADSIYGIQVNFTLLEPFRNVNTIDYNLQTSELDYQTTISPACSVAVNPIFSILPNTQITEIVVGVGLSGEVTIPTLTIEETINQGDLLTLDFENKEVRLNNEIIDWDGYMNQLQPIVQNRVEFHFTGTAGPTTIKLQYYERFL